MGSCISKPETQEYPKANHGEGGAKGSVYTPEAPAHQHQGNPFYEAAADVTVEFTAEDRPGPNQRQPSLGGARPKLPSVPAEEPKPGILSPTGVYVPSSGFKTSQLVEKMKEKYDLPGSEVEQAIDFAESEEYVDVYCFTHCITGGPMEPTAFKVAGLQGMDKHAILQWAKAPGNEDLRVLNAEEQKRHNKARDDFLVDAELQREKEDEEERPEDLEELTEAYRIRFESDTENLSLEEVMDYFGVPEISKVAIHKHLHPAKGAAKASIDEKARRKAAHPIALERFDMLS